jgi:hypothetical protein
MFHESRAKLPKFVGTSTPEEVAEGVMRAIERNRAEIDVAPLPLRAGAVAGGLAPELVATAQRLLGGDGVAAELTAAQTSKR